MKINIICVGKIKEEFFKRAILEYTKRLKKYVKLEIIEISDLKIPENASEIEKQNIKLKEGELILKKIKNEFVIGLCIDGQSFDSIEFSDFVKEKKLNGISNISFIIGGSLGLGSNVLSRCNFKISFSKMTFPHQLIRVFLLEQLYRIEKIQNNETYHK